MVSLCCYCGLLIFERFGACDPRAAGLLQADDQLLPAYVALSASNLPGVIGIFVAGVFGAALRLYDEQTLFEKFTLGFVHKLNDI